MKNDLPHALEQLRQGNLITLPTETVYGLAADARNPTAVARIFAVKKRPAAHPVIVHIPSREHLTRWASHVPEYANTLAEHFWPGPLTLILPKQTHVLACVTGGQDSVGLRVPNHPIALDLLSLFNDGIAAPSANRYGKISPTTVEHVRSDLGDEVQCYLDGGPCDVGIESTIVLCTGDLPVILREGIITAEQIANLLQSDVCTKLHDHTVRAPGDQDSHYAPNTPLYIMAAHEVVYAKSAAVLSFQERPTHHEPSHWIQASTDPTLYAHNLYSFLRRLDSLAAAAIVVEHPPKRLEWVAILDRLVRAESTLK